MSKSNVPIIKRYFSDANLSRIKKDFDFLIKFVLKSNGEFDLAIREDYFNIYYKGNSLARITPTINDKYTIQIHSKFIDPLNPIIKPYLKLPIKNYAIFKVPNNYLHKFLQVKILNKFASKIKEVNNGEEIGFEQSLITDNLNRDDYIIIDRQIMDKIYPKRVDLLILKQIKDNKYKFIVAEIKLGNNPELVDKVAIQLSGYKTHVSYNFDDYKQCYEKHYEQKKFLGLITNPSFPMIEIMDPVEEMVIVGGYSGIAKQQILVLKGKYPNLLIKHFLNKL